MASVTELKWLKNKNKISLFGLFLSHQNTFWFSIIEQAIASLENSFDTSSILIGSAKMQAVLWSVCLPPSSTLCVVKWYGYLKTKQTKPSQTPPSPNSFNVNNSVCSLADDYTSFLIGWNWVHSASIIRHGGLCYVES